MTATPSVPRSIEEWETVSDPPYRGLVSQPEATQPWSYAKSVYCGEGGPAPLGPQPPSPGAFWALTLEASMSEENWRDNASAFVLRELSVYKLSGHVRVGEDGSRAKQLLKPRKSPFSVRRPLKNTSRGAQPD